MKEKQIEIGKHKIKIKELSWDAQLQLSEADKFSTRQYMKISIIEPEDKEKLFKEMRKSEGNKLLEEINEINRGDEEITDFQQPNQEETKKKD
jgi:hypothetical protein|tara:strand:- start:250 stop:528 length:279 start_codon:yes stop_codon:yes gene_type:complete